MKGSISKRGGMRRLRLPHAALACASLLVPFAGAGAASIRVEVDVQAPAEQVWSAVRDFQAVHERLARGFVVDTHPAGPADDVRVVTFANGAVVKEVLLGSDDALHRLAYSSIEGRAQIHAASMEVVEVPGGCRIVWTTDVLPDAVAASIRPMMEQGAIAMKQTLEADARTPGDSR